MTTPTGGPLCTQCSMYQPSGATTCGQCQTPQFLLFALVSNQMQNRPNKRRRATANQCSNQDIQGIGQYAAVGFSTAPIPFQHASNQNPYAVTASNPPVAGLVHALQDEQSEIRYNPQIAPQQPVIPTSPKLPNAGARKAAEWKVARAQRQALTIKHDGNYGFTSVEQRPTGWCYVHHHPLDQENCTLEDTMNACLRSPFLLSWHLVEDHGPLLKGHRPTRIYECLDVLKRLSDTLYHYAYFVPLRDAVQQHFMGGFGVFSNRGDLFKQLFKANNTRTATFILNMLRWSKHACRLLLENLLAALHVHGLAHHILNASTANANEITALYNMLVHVNSIRGMDRHPILSVNLTNPGLWQEFTELISVQARQLVQDIAANVKVYPDLRQSIESRQDFAEVIDDLLYGGFCLTGVEASPYALPRITYTDWVPLMRKLDIELPTWQPLQNNGQSISGT